MNKITETQKAILISLYNEGRMDTEIAENLCITRSAVQYWRKKLGLKTKFQYNKISKIDNVKFEELFYKGKSDAEIAEALNMSYDGVYAHRVRHGYIRENRKFGRPLPLTEFQEQVLIGTMLGDSTLAKRDVNAHLICAHCVEKEEYTKYKAEIFKSLHPKVYYISQYDKRTNKTYKRCAVRLPANPELNKYYSIFYRPKKVIPKELFDKFTAVSLAFLFMDDGCGSEKNYTIATNCFQRDNIEEFRTFLLEKFNLHTTIRKDNTLYVKHRSMDLFTSLIEPYMCNCMKYKLNSRSKTP